MEDWFDYLALDYELGGREPGMLATLYQLAEFSQFDDSFGITGEVRCSIAGRILDQMRAGSENRRALGPDEYHAYIASPDWRCSAARIEALEKSDWRCQVCFNPNDLNVHHRTYARLGHEHPSDLTVLCRGCHKLFHLNSRLWARHSTSKGGVINNSWTGENI